MPKKISLKELQNTKKAITPEQNNVLNNPRKFKYFVHTVALGLAALVVFNIFFGVRNFYLTSKAIEIVQTRDFGYHDLRDQLKQRTEELSNRATYELDTNYKLTSDPGYYNSLQLDAYERRQSNASAPEWTKPIIEVDYPIWEAHVRSGDGDKTPSTYIWVKGTQKIHIYKRTQFSDQKVKISDEQLVYGAFLIDLDHNTYSGSGSDGSGWVDFWNMERIDETWKPIPTKLK
jgi:hypothetical protein